MHRRAALVSGVGFFTDAYDLFVISTVAVLVTKQWHLDRTQTSWVTGAAILGAFVGAVAFGRLADRIGRRPVYGIVAALMVLGALASAFAPSFGTLVAARLLLGLGIGGDYPVSAVLMSEYSNRADRGRMVSIVFSMQAVGLVVGPAVAIALLESGIGGDLTWRLLLGFGAIPAAAVIWLRTRMPESPRFRAEVQGDEAQAARDLAAFARFGGAGDAGEAPAAAIPARAPGPRAAAPVGGLWSMLTQRRTLTLLVGTAGAWFLFDYAYYGNTLSLPAILTAVDPHASTVGKLALSLLLFVVFAVPGYLLAIYKMDTVGHRRLQVLGFAVMAVAFLALGLVHSLTTVVPAFVAIFGVSYFFVEFGPNTTTFVLPAEVFPTHQRTTGHGFAAGLGKLGAFVGVFLVPKLQSGLGLRGMLLVAAAASVAGLACSRLLPEPGRRSLHEVAAAPAEGDELAA
ncbi:MAG TPA: MFS transporter [Acidimicrobiales bacterium]|nr:MFS transporter [Acidimicrobiales bacterium]